MNKFIKDSNYNLTLKLTNLNGTSTSLWSLTDTQLQSGSKNKWQYGQIKYYSSEAYRITLEATTGSNSKHFIGIDDINFLSGSRICTGMPSIAVQGDQVPTTPAITTQKPSDFLGEFDCNFEKACNWVSSTDNSDYNWIVKPVLQSDEFLDAPQTDHTFLQPGKGSYLGMFSSDTTAKTKTYYTSPVLNGTVSKYKCLEFWYYMYGPNAGRISVQRSRNTNKPFPYTIWSTQGSARPGWQMKHLRIGYGLSSVTYNVKFVYEMTGDSYNGFAAIDDIVIQENECAPVDYCDFEDNQCGFTNDATADFEWQRGNSSTSTLTTGPSIDHTLGTSEGLFMYIDASKQKELEKSRLDSPIQSKTAGSCVHFYFHMNGFDIGTLNVYAKSQSLLGDPLVAYNTNIGDYWWSSQLNIVKNTDWQVVFEAVRGHGNNGNIAIDDVRISKGSCLNTASCDFEKETLCEYTNSPLNKINWVIADIKSLLSTTDFQGPFIDHTYGTNKGNYAIFNTLSSEEGDTGRIISEIIQGGSFAKCFKFYFNMYSVTSSKVGSLNIYVKDLKMNQEQLIWSLSNSQTKRGEWKEGRFSIGNSDQYQIIFEGVRYFI